MFDFRRITLLCLEKRLSKHKMVILFKNFGGGMAPLAPPGYAHAVDCYQCSKYKVLFSNKNGIYRALSL